MTEQATLCRRCGRCFFDASPGNVYDALHGLPPLCMPCWEAVHDDEPEVPLDRIKRAAGDPTLPGLS